MLIRELCLSDSESYRHFLCMKNDTLNFDELLFKVAPFITYNDTFMRLCLPVVCDIIKTRVGFFIVESTQSPSLMSKK